MREVVDPEFAAIQAVVRLSDGFISPNEADRNGEPANVVDGLFAIARSINRLATVMATAHGVVSPKEK